MTLQDIFLTPIYLIFIYGFIFYLRSTIQDRTLRGYFLPAFNVKIIGAVALGVIYQFYYGGGDTFNFFRDARAIWLAFLDSPWLAFKIIFAKVGDQSPDIYKYTRLIYFFSAGDAQTYNAIRLVGFFSLFTFYTYTLVAICFAMVSFSGMWAMYKALYHMYPHLHRPLAYAVFFIPSVYFWGSGVMKDTIAMGALGWTFYSFYFGLIKRKNIVINLLILFLSIFVIRSIKIYIIATFLPAASIWLFLQYRTNIKSRALRTISLPILLALAIPLGYLAIVQITMDNERYQLENIAKTTQVTAEWLHTVSEREGGSGYTLGNFDGTLTGMLRNAPRAIWLGLFQPHLWQARNPVMLLSAIEATFFLILTARIIFQIGFFRLYKILFEHPILIFCLSFSLVFAFAVAMASYNFGTMVRYRIPLMPFYLSMLYIIRYQINRSVKLF